MCHPSDGEAWKHFDAIYLDFVAEPRNIRLGLCVDGLSPFSVGAARYLCCPVFITLHKLSSEMLMTNPYIFLNYVVPSLHNPKSRIDVCLQHFDQ